MSDWQPGSNIETMRTRAHLNRCIRDFFALREVMEVEVPLLATATVTDPHIASIPANLDGQSVFLQTSPEFFMKRLLCAGSGAIYSLGKAFRAGESGGRHNPEFTMLEWYRPGFDDVQLMGEVESLIKGVLPELTDTRSISYRDLFKRFLSIDPHTVSLAELQRLGQVHCRVDWRDDHRDTWLDLLMTHVIEPQLGEGLVFVYDYPESQAALARIEPDASGQRVAKRFEAYVAGMELANGYWELTDATEQARRFDVDAQHRIVLGLENFPKDRKLLAALASGMPDTAGVALGVDRLLMLMSGVRSIDQVLNFSITRC